MVDLVVSFSIKTETFRCSFYLCHSTYCLCRLPTTLTELRFRLNFLQTYVMLVMVDRVALIAVVEHQIVFVPSLMVILNENKFFF